jgi:hypothetical protein
MAAWSARLVAAEPTGALLLWQYLRHHVQTRWGFRRRRRVDAVAEVTDVRTEQLGDTTRLKPRTSLPRLEEDEEAGQTACLFECRP